jgi:hypothetical protein
MMLVHTIGKLIEKRVQNCRVILFLLFWIIWQAAVGVDKVQSYFVSQ